MGKLDIVYSLNSEGEGAEDKFMQQCLPFPWIREHASHLTSEAWQLGPSSA